jgi:CheY-like chemotaxis protein
VETATGPSKKRTKGGPFSADIHRMSEPMFRPHGAVAAGPGGCGASPEAVVAALWQNLLPRAGVLLRSWNPVTDVTSYAGDLEAFVSHSQPLSPGLESWTDFVHPEDQPAFRREMAASVEGHGAPLQEYRLIGLDGNTRMVREYQHLLEGSGAGQLTLLALITDITASRAMECRLQHLQKMESFSRLVGGVAHDFNNLISIIVGYTELVLEEGSIGENLRPMLAEVQLAAQRATALTTQLLAFNHAPLSLRVQTFDLNDVMRDAGKMLRRVLGEQVDLQVIPAATPCMIKAGRSRWEQGFIEMAVLAREAMPAGGSLAIAAASLEAPPAGFASFSPGTLLTVSGAPRDAVSELPPPHLAPAFLQSLQFVKEHGGMVQPEPEATLIFLPSEHAEQRPRPAAAAAATGVQGGGETILFVEDDSTVRRLGAGSLARKGYRIIEAETAEEAITLAASASSPRPQLLITDLVLPGLSGRELAVELAGRDPSLCVIFTSGYPSQALAPVAGLEGRFAFLQKPFAPKALYAQVRTLLDRGQAALAA